MVIRRGDLCWAELGPARGSRPVLVMQADDYNASRLATVVVAVVTSNTALAAMPGTTFLPAAVTGLPRDSVVNVTALITLNKTDLAEAIGSTPTNLMDDIDRGLRRFLDLEAGHRSPPTHTDRSSRVSIRPGRTGIHRASSPDIH